MMTVSIIFKVDYKIVCKFLIILVLLTYDCIWFTDGCSMYSAGKLESYLPFTTEGAATKFFIIPQRFYFEVQEKTIPSYFNV